MACLPTYNGIRYNSLEELYKANGVNEQQKQQAQQLYSQYLDTIFSDSKVKDIVYHGSKNKIDKFSLEETRKSQLLKYPDLPTVDAFFLTPSKITTKAMTSEEVVINPALINSKNPLKVTNSIVKENNISTLAGTILFTNSPEMISKYKKLGYDTFDSSSNAANEYVVFEPEQIHILGSKQDIEGFKEFVQGKQSVTPRQGIAEVFAENPQLASIGTQEQYERYLSTIFSDSKVKDIVYHGSNQKIEQFEIKKEPLIHFGTKSAALQRGNILHQILLNIRDLQTIKDGMWFLGTQEGGLLRELLDRNILTIEEVRSIIEVKNKTIENSYSDHYGARIAEGEKKGNEKLQEILKDRNIGFEYINLSEDKGSISYAVPSQKQIHILGSKQDIEGFREFVSKNMYQLGSELFKSDKAKSPREKWDDIVATPKSTFKFLYYTSLEAAESDYRRHIEDFGYSAVSFMKSSADLRYKYKIAIRQPKDEQNLKAEKADEIIQNNVREMSKERYPVNMDLLLDNFDLYYPEMAHKDIDEKRAFMEGLTNGEIEIMCGL